MTRRDARRELELGRLREPSSDRLGRGALFDACAFDSPLRGGHAELSTGLEAASAKKKHSKWVDQWYTRDSARGVRERR